jgi:hypothetical protein
MVLGSMANTGHALLCDVGGDAVLKKRIHVNQHIIKRNGKTGEREPPLTCKTYKENIKCTEVEILGNCKVVYSPDKPLSCGAKVWIETDSEVVCL